MHHTSACISWSTCLSRERTCVFCFVCILQLSQQLLEDGNSNFLFSNFAQKYISNLTSTFWWQTKLAIALHASKVGLVPTPTLPNKCNIMPSNSNSRVHLFLCLRRYSSIHWDSSTKMESSWSSPCKGSMHPAFCGHHDVVVEMKRLLPPTIKRMACHEE